MSCCGGLKRDSDGCRNNQFSAAGHVGSQQHGEIMDVRVDMFEERAAMILGMNSDPLRENQSWLAYEWHLGLHWALVLVPVGHHFTARAVDDFVRGAQGCFNIEIPSTRMFLVYELLVDAGRPYLLLTVKPDFDPDRPSAQVVGTFEGMTFEDITDRALTVAHQYRGYSLVGCNCQHFVRDLAEACGMHLVLPPDDEAAADMALDGAAKLGAASCGFAAAAASGAASSSIALGAGSLYFTAAAAAGLVGVVSALALVGFAAGYRCLYDQFRGASETDGHDGHEKEKRS